ncbi:MAG: 2-aminoadipate transaminase [Anaerolineae bacterium]|nr:2-aminoadipate transaminase [Anaerolineae bacterium]
MLAQRMQHLQKSFIREILKVTEKPDIISFAGGLPNPAYFPAAQLADAAQKVLLGDGQAALQYSTTEGHPPLRRYIANRYHRFGIEVSPDQILITNGSQQGLDLIGKLLINPGDPVVIERPGYLGAIQSFSLYEPDFRPVPLLADGIDLEQLASTLDAAPVKLMYTTPNFQNPSGLTYSAQTRAKLAELVGDRRLILVEDNPYGELRFTGEHQPSFWNLLPDRVILLGSFSKVVAPALRLGWLVVPPALLDKLIAAKQAADLHSNYLTQRILYQFLQDNDLDAHLQTIRAAYKRQAELMVSMLEELFPPEVKFTRPEGGMFVWVTLPEEVSALALLEEATRQNVAFVPGQPFYVDGGGQNSLRLNFSNADEAAIETGMQRLAGALKTVLAKR